MSKVEYYTAEGLEKIKAELHHMIMVERPNISQQIGEAIEKGDLSENAEYDAAKDAQGILEVKIARLNEIVANARLIDESKIDNSKVYILSKVTIQNIKNKAKMTYTIVAEKEADIKQLKISVSSPIGKGLLGKAVGDICEITVPQGKMEFEILDITRG